MNLAPTIDPATCLLALPVPATPAPVVGASGSGDFAPVFDGALADLLGPPPTAPEATTLPAVRQDSAAVGKALPVVLAQVSEVSVDLPALPNIPASASEEPAIPAGKATAASDDDNDPQHEPALAWLLPPVATLPVVIAPSASPPVNQPVVVSPSAGQSRLQTTDPAPPAPTPLPGLVNIAPSAPPAPVTAVASNQVPPSPLPLAERLVAEVQPRTEPRPALRDLPPSLRALGDTAKSAIFAPVRADGAPALIALAPLPIVAVAVVAPTANPAPAQPASTVGLSLPGEAALVGSAAFVQVGAALAAPAIGAEPRVLPVAEPVHAQAMVAAAALPIAENASAAPVLPAAAAPVLVAQFVGQALPNREPVRTVPRGRDGPVIGAPVGATTERSQQGPELPALSGLAESLVEEWRPAPRPVAFELAAQPAAAMTATALRPAETPVPASPATGIDLTRDPGLNRMIDRIETLRDAAMDGGVRDTRIRLIPDALGPVDIAVRRDGDAVHVHFTASETATRQIILDAQPRLAELAEARGIRIERATVDGGATGGQLPGQANGQAQQQHQPNHAAALRNRAATAAKTEPNQDERIA